MQPVPDVASAGAAADPAPPAIASGPSSEHPRIQLLHTGLGESLGRSYVPRTERRPGLTYPDNHQPGRRPGKTDLASPHSPMCQTLAPPSPATDGHTDTPRHRSDGHPCGWDRHTQTLLWPGQTDRASHVLPADRAVEHTPPHPTFVQRLSLTVSLHRGLFDGMLQ